MEKEDKIFDDIIIYKLSCKNPSVLPFYIGSTTDLYCRMATHKHWSKNTKKQCYLYKFIRDFGGYDNFKFDILAHHKNKTLKEKKDYEKQFIDMYKPQLNKQVIGRTLKEYTKDNREKINRQNMMSHYKHLEKRRAYLRKRYHDNKDKYLPMMNETMKKNKKRYDINRKFKVNCLCGCQTNYSYRHNHRRGKQHADNMIKIKKEIIDICTKLKPITNNKRKDSE